MRSSLFVGIAFFGILFGSLGESLALVHYLYGRLNARVIGIEETVERIAPHEVVDYVTHKVMLEQALRFPYQYIPALQAVLVGIGLELVDDLLLL